MNGEEPTSQAIRQTGPEWSGPKFGTAPLLLHGAHPRIPWETIHVTLERVQRRGSQDK